MSNRPVVVIGAGPQGLAAAAQLLERGLDPLVLEAGDGPAAAVQEWAHVRLFSDWSELVDASARRLLEPTGWEAPASGYPTGGEWIAGYLAPLAAALDGRVRFGSRVTNVERDGEHFRVSVGSESIAASAVIDASGTWAQPNPAGATGALAVGELEAAHLISYRIPTSVQAKEFAGQRVVVVGSGHSATTALNALARGGARITWVLRRGTADSAFGGGEADELPARGALGVTARRLVDAGTVELVTGFRTTRIDTRDGGPVLVAEDGRELAADHLVVLTGFSPDLSMLATLRLDLDPRLEAPTRIAAQIDPEFHSCGTVSATGARDLAHPEKDFYLVGAKSYGRAPTFLALTGYEQVRSIAAELAGDHESASRVELVLPTTGVCGGTGVADSGGCCDDTALPMPRVRAGVHTFF
jgi:cation diffusion facilitator CzcD-associated flavoprotein CzcO